LSPVVREPRKPKPFQRLGQGCQQRRAGKRLKPFPFIAAACTRLKPGVNEIKIRRQEIELRPDSVRTAFIWLQLNKRMRGRS